MSKINVDTWEPESGTAMTLGASDSTITVLGSTRVGFGVAWQAVQTTGFTAVAGKGYPCNTTSGAFTCTLPASASVGDQIALVDYAGTFDTNNLTINSNSLNMRGATTNTLVQKERIGIVLTYVDVTQGWVATSGANTGTSSMELPSYSVDFLVIAGGGAGGHDQGGGGGAGGYRASYNSEASGGGGSSESSLTFNTGIEYTATVGAGGAGVNSGAANDGVDSSLSGSDITTITSTGGGKGSLYNTTGAGVGGSGGGAAGVPAGATSGAAGTANQGYAGGNGTTNLAGGGGGAGAVGANYSGSTGGVGGAGVASTITGSSILRGGGGGGSANNGAGGRSAGAGGSGGGGRGTVTGWASDVDGTANTGGGGGGGWGGSPTGSGGTGVVILRMPTAYYTGTSTGSPSVSTDGTDTILTFNDTGSYTA